MIFYTVISHTALFWFLVVIASIVVEHYTDNILKKETSLIHLGVDRDWIECKDRQLWVEIGIILAVRNTFYQYKI